MARGGSGGGSKGGAQTVPYGGGNIANNRYGGGFGGVQPNVTSRQPAPLGGIVAGGPNPYGSGNSLGASADRIISDMRYNHNIGGYQGLPQERFQQRTDYRPQIQPFQPQPFRPQVEPIERYDFGSPMYSARSQPQPMPFRAPSPGKGGSKGGGMSVPRNQFQQMPMMENPLGNRGGMMRTMEMRPGRDYIPFRPPARQMQFMQAQPLQQQATLQGLGGFFR